MSHLGKIFQSKKYIFTVAFYLEKLYKHPKIRDDGVIPSSYVGGATFGQIMGSLLIMYCTDFPGTNKILSLS